MSRARSQNPQGPSLFPRHWKLFLVQAGRIEQKDVIPLLDTFLHRDWINAWAREIGFREPIDTGGKDSTDQHEKTPGADRGLNVP